MSKRQKRLPRNWEELYTGIKAFRESTKAPVDDMGCGTLADARDPKIKRYHTLVSLQLSSQTKDQTTAQAVRNLQNSPGGLTVDTILGMSDKELNEHIAQVGFHNRKVQYLKKTAAILKESFDSDVPDALEDLLSLPGVGPKMAYLCLQHAWGKQLGIGVDVHVHRISNRIGYCSTKTPEQTRMELESWLPREYWGDINGLLVGFGQTMCTPVRPKCTECPVATLCPKIGTKTSKRGA